VPFEVSTLAVVELVSVSAPGLGSLGIDGLVQRAIRAVYMGVLGKLARSERQRSATSPRSRFKSRSKLKWSEMVLTTDAGVHSGSGSADLSVHSPQLGERMAEGAP